ncbi:hypothetical protein LSTR_LSTR000877 [Laodelphax striatellus]|uniref:BTB domain-containing protein n=1 Tax=Laodelphax striatellus TaxID=195883 RepID=A0A482X1B6_LAOST|nr:hypothetical protein LSTR_LSTR000877 [Laodelphax striatellus]
MSSAPPSLRSKFELCLNNDDLSDCEFLVGNQKCRIKGHKLLFGISSPVFRAMLYDGINSNSAATYEIEDVEADVFHGMKQFFYTDSVNFTSGLHACSVYLASWKYVIPDLMSKCVQYITDNLSVSEAIDVYEFSRLNNIPNIETICSAVFQNKTREIMQSEKLLSSDILTLETILKMDSLKLESEFEVFKYTEKWALAEASRKNIDLQQQGEYFNCIKRHIRFLTMDKDQYQEGPFMSDLVTSEEKLSITHNLLGLGVGDRFPQKLSRVTEPRIFTKEKEEEEEEEVKEEVEEEEGYDHDEEGYDYDEEGYDYDDEEELNRQFEYIYRSRPAN